jgi:hypothetical protein
MAICVVLVCLYSKWRIDGRKAAREAQDAAAVGVRPEIA